MVDVGPRPTTTVVTGLAASTLDLGSKLLAVWIVVTTTADLFFDFEGEPRPLALVATGAGSGDVPTF